MSLEKRFNEILQTLNLFSLFIDRLEKYRYMTPYFTLGIYQDPISWSISKLGIVDVIEPHQYFFGEAYKDKNKHKLHVRDQPGNLPEEIEELYRLSSIKRAFPNYDPLKWRDGQFLKMAKAKYPDAFIYLDKKKELATKFRKERALNIDMVMESDGSYYIELLYDVANMSIEEELSTLFKGIEVLREIYREVYEAKDEDQIIVMSNRTAEVDMLREYLYLVRRFLISLEDKLKNDILINVISIKNASFIHGKNIWIDMESAGMELIRIRILDLREEKQIYTLMIDMVPCKKQYDKYLERMKALYPHAEITENGFTIELQTDTQGAIIENIQNILENLT